MEKKAAAKKVRKHYAFKVSFSFEMQYTFTEAEVQQAEEGDEDEFDPTDEALAALRNEVRKYLEQQYAVDKVEAIADFDSLIGTTEG